MLAALLLGLTQLSVQISCTFWNDFVEFHPPVNPRDILNRTLLNVFYTLY